MRHGWRAGKADRTIFSTRRSKTDSGGADRTRRPGCGDRLIPGLGCELLALSHVGFGLP